MWEALPMQDAAMTCYPKIRPPLRPTLSTPGVSVAGVDGCKAGWVVVRRNRDGCFEAPFVAETLDAFPPADFVVIDIPIGLPASGKRECDRIARDLLGPRRNSVFTGVRRPLLSKSTYEEANAWAKRNGAGISKQLWGIVQKIDEVDNWITPERSRTFREGHPELSFLAAAGGPMKFAKKKPGGETERLEVLVNFIDRSTVLNWLDEATHFGVAWDDIMDALALCRTAARVALGCHGQLPADPPRDACGLPMEMVF